MYGLCTAELTHKEDETRITMRGILIPVVGSSLQQISCCLVPFCTVAEIVDAWLMVLDKHLRIAASRNCGSRESKVVAESYSMDYKRTKRKYAED